MTLHIVRTSYATVYLYGTCMVHVFHHTGDTYIGQSLPAIARESAEFKDELNDKFADTLSQS